MSLPSWERGLKSTAEENPSCWCNVAPFVGAWIEIGRVSKSTFSPASLPSWERGLKFHGVQKYTSCHRVAPFVGAWIEIEISGGRAWRV